VGLSLRMRAGEAAGRRRPEFRDGAREGVVVVVAVEVRECVHAFEVGGFDVRWASSSTLRSTALIVDPSVRRRFERVELQAEGAGVDGPVGDSR
jgi:hypothetical protein